MTFRVTHEHENVPPIFGAKRTNEALILSDSDMDEKERKSYARM
ncbi:MAG: hypothetical protein C5S49_04055 [Candidatus Methanogaster sp.]|nr:MAG: hypothetical protein C5S49_04055 [ANME-2 cluster archaeon]